MGLFKSKEDKIKEEELNKYLDESSDEEDVDTSFKEMLKLLKEKDNDEESLKYLPEEERNKIIEDDKYNKKIIKEVIIIFSVVIVVMIIGLNAFIYYNKSDLEKNISPVLLNYYQDKYSVKTSINSIDYICLKASYGQEKECSNIIDAVTKDGYHIMSIDGLIGDNRSVDSVKNSYIEYIKSINPDMSLLVNNAILSYKDYYINY
ncbi:MAG TPA: hypothetical protein PKG93_04470, partial [Bacilli bacterium]|nr:hypothetical protein [Bacilli bacterium]